MKDRKKYMRLLSCLLCLVVCAAFLLTGCRDSEKTPTEPNDSVAETTTEPETETTVENESTEPDTQETTEEATEEPTEGSGSSSSGIGNGTGGSYKPQEPQPDTTEPEVTEPVIEVPAAGTLENPYYEDITAPGSFKTVKLSAKGTVNYTLKTAGAILKITSDGAAVVYDGKTYQPVDGVLELPLPDVKESVKTDLQFVNNGTGEQMFTVEVLEAVGAKSNPIAVTDIAALQVKLEQGGPDGLYYTWTADQTGVLTIGLSSIKPASASLDMIVTVGNKTAKLSESDKGILQIPVSVNDAVVVQVVAEADAAGNIPAVEAIVSGSVLPVKTLEADSIPKVMMTEKVSSGENAYYNVTGVSGTVLTVLDADVTVCYDGKAYGADENGVVSVQLGDEETVQLELINNSAEDKTYSLSFRYPAGHKLNPKTLTELGDVEVVIKAGTDGYYYTYTTPNAGKLTFRVKTTPENQSVLTGVTLTNENTQAVDSLLTAAASEETVSVVAGAGHRITIHVTLTDGGDICVDGALTLLGEYINYQQVACPGFVAEVPANGVCYFAGDDLGESIFTMEATDATVLHNNVTYLPQDGKILFLVEAEDGAPATFAIENHGDEDAVYTVTLHYPEGSRKNPTEILLGESGVSSQEGATGYWFSYTAPKSGELVLNFDPEKNWCYAVNGGETFYSDAENTMAEQAVAVNSGEKVLIWVNTYDPEAPDTAPAGEVSFRAKLVSSPVELDLTQAYDAQVLMQETAQFTGNLRNAIITFTNAERLTVTYNGQTYTADDWGIIKVNFLEPDGEGQWKFTVTNDSFTDRTCTMQFSGTVGSWLNPAQLVLGTNRAQQAENAAEYCFSYTAPKAGILSLSFDMASDWYYAINDGEKQYSDSVPANAEVAVAEGDKVVIRLNTYDPAAPDTIPAGTVSFTATLITGPALIEDPRTPYEASVLAGETARFTGPFEDATVTIIDAQDAYVICNETVYEADTSGVITFTVLQSQPDGTWEFSLYNGSEEVKTCTMSFTGPVGSWLNPAEMVLSHNTAELTENAKDYYYTYAAPKSGTLVLSFDEADNWYYILNDGEKRYSSDPAVKTVEIPVEKDEVVSLQLNTYDPNVPQTTPAGTVTFTATLITGPVTVTNLAQPLPINFLAGETVIVNGPLGGEKLSIGGADELILVWNETEYTADSNGLISLTFPADAQTDQVTFSLHNGGADGMYTLIFGEEKGTQTNPAELIVGNNIAVCQAGSEGYYFTFTNTTDAKMKLKIDFSQTETDWYYKKGTSSAKNSSGAARSFSFSVNAGASVTILVRTYDPENPENIPAGAVEFIMSIG